MIENDADKIRSTMERITALLLAKNHDYGSSFRFSGGLSGLPATTKLLVRIEDKMTRLANLLQNINAEVANENIVDTIHDIHGYLALLEILLTEEPMNPIDKTLNLLEKKYTRCKHPATRGGIGVAIKLLKNECADLINKPLLPLPTGELNRFACCHCPHCDDYMFCCYDGIESNMEDVAERPENCPVKWEEVKK